MAADSFKSFSKTLIQSALGKLGLQLISTERTGIEFVNEIRRTKTEIKIVFDVGANVGKTSEYYLKCFPSATIHAFEPVSQNFEVLRLKAGTRLNVNQSALGAHEGEVKIYLSRHPCMHSAIVAENPNQFEMIEMRTLDNYCAERSIERIGLLKIDTEGNDLNVLLGADQLLAKRQIDFIYLETGFYSKPRHINICAFLDHLTSRGYFLLGIYEQSWRRGGAARVDFANALFAREGMLVLD